MKAKKEPKKKKKDFYFATGRRKEAVARTRLHEGKGEFLVNERKMENYFPVFSLQRIILAPLKLVGLEKEFYVKVKVRGGGIHSQADAIVLGIARALLKKEPDLKKTLKDAGFLTRDPREKERKKPGLKRARRAPQWKKR